MVYDTLDRIEKELKEDRLPEEDEGFLSKRVSLQHLSGIVWSRVKTMWPT